MSQCAVAPEDEQMNEPVEHSGFPEEVAHNETATPRVDKQAHITPQALPSCIATAVTSDMC